MENINWQQIAAVLSHSVGRSYQLSQPRALGGGCINQVWRLDSNNGPVLLKLNAARYLAMFAAEFDGLLELAASNTIRVPQPIAYGQDRQHSFLALEYITLRSSTQFTARRLGQQLARMHRYSNAQFGWYRDNTIGATPQPNRLSDDWIDFYRCHRLGFQLQLAARNGAGSALLNQGERLLAVLPSFFESYQPPPSLLHGDLWGGNVAGDDQGEAVIFDPAVYYGDRETDLAMSELFGGFSADFYAAYNETWELDSGYSQRKTLYNLYHILNHFNLFGGGYAVQAQRMTEQLLTSIKA